MNNTVYTDEFDGFVRDLEHSVFKLIKESSKAPKDLYEQWCAFSSAVNWNQKWIQIILAFHVIMLTIILLTRHNVTIQLVLFFIFAVIIMSLEQCNSYASQHWKKFSDQNYFDQHGIFMGLIVAAPLLILCFIQLINLLMTASTLLIKAKRMKLLKTLNSTPDLLTNQTGSQDSSMSNNDTPNTVTLDSQSTDDRNS